MTESARRKVQRAETLMVELGNAINVYLARRPYTYFDDVDPATGEPAISIKLSEPVPLAIGEVCGDVIANLRAAVDHAATALAALNGQGPANIYFPIADGKGEFGAKAAQKRLNVFTSEVRAFIETWEPFRWGKGHSWWALHRLENTNKHRNYIDVRAINIGNFVTVDGPRGIESFGAHKTWNLEWQQMILIHRSTIATSRVIDIDVVLDIVFNDPDEAFNSHSVRRVFADAVKLTLEFLAACDDRFFKPAERAANRSS
ncbi:MAG: hypothetical protein ACT4O6_12625 [Reyranella sp.]